MQAEVVQELANGEGNPRPSYQVVFQRSSPNLHCGADPGLGTAFFHASPSHSHLNILDLHPGDSCQESRGTFQVYHEHIEKDYN